MTGGMKQRWRKQPEGDGEGDHGGDMLPDTVLHEEDQSHHESWLELVRTCLHTLMPIYDTRLISFLGDDLFVCVNVAVEMGDSTLVTNPETCADVLEHSDIVADHEYTALKVLQSSR